MNNTLIYKGLQNDDEETIRNVKSAFIAELELSVDKVAEIIGNPPTVIIEGLDDEKLEHFRNILEKAGAIIEVQGNKTSCLSHWLEDESFEEEISFDEGNSTLTYDDSPLDLGDLSLELDESEEKKESPAAESINTDELTFADSEELSLDNSEELSFDDSELTFQDEIKFEDDEKPTEECEQHPKEDKSEDNSENITEQAKPSSIEFDDASYNEPISEETDSEPTILQYEESAPATEQASESHDDNNIVSSPEEPQNEPTEHETLLPESMQPAPKLNYRKKNKFPWDVVIIATIGVILLGIGNWFYFRG